MVVARTQLSSEWMFCSFIEFRPVCVCLACENIDGDQLATVKLLPAVWMDAAVSVNRKCHRTNDSSSFLFLSHWRCYRQLRPTNVIYFPFFSQKQMCSLLVRSCVRVVYSAHAFEVRPQPYGEHLGSFHSQCGSHIFFPFGSLEYSPRFLSRCGSQQLRIHFGVNLWHLNATFIR